MHTVKDIVSEVLLLNGFRSLVRAYEEIASMRMKRTRGIVLKNRQFLVDIQNIFEKVRQSYAKEVGKLAKRNRKNKELGSLTFLSHNGKTVSVLLSSNAGLYGAVLQSTFEKFINDVGKSDAEVTIVGKYGLSLFQEEVPGHPYTYFELSDDIIVSRDLNEIIKHIVQYDEIHVYYGKFITVISQKAEMFTFTSEINLHDENVEEPVSFIFEPNLEDILMFFEAQIFSATFEQTVRESQLAKFASRVLAMDRADEKIKERSQKLSFEKTRAIHRNSNKKQINSIASMSMW